MLKAQLETSGYFEVLEENDETRAVRTAREFGPNLVLLDLMMPNLEGSELAALLRADPQVGGTPVLFLTALVTDDDAPDGGGCVSGGHTFLPKSLPTFCLMQSIDDALRGSRAAVAV